MSNFEKLVKYFKDNDIELLAVLVLVKILQEDIENKDDS